jgi:hypothetical protein
MSTPQQTSEYLEARRESCRLLNLNADDLTAHEAIRADLLTVLRLWLDSSQSTLIAGGSADPTKILAVADVLGRLVPEPEHKTRRVDPREHMWRIYKEMRDNGEIPPEGTLQAKINEQAAEIERLKSALAEALAVPTLASPLPDNVVPMPRATAGKQNPAAATPQPSPPPPAAASAPVLGDLVMVCDPSPEEPWKSFVEPDGSIRATPFDGGKYWGPV